MDRAKLHQVLRESHTQKDVPALSPALRIQWAARQFPGRIVASSSFGADSAVLLHLIATTAPEIPIVFLNTGFHFPQTLAYRERLQREWGLIVRDALPAESTEEFLDRHGPAFRSNPDFCCARNKVEPMRRALAGAACWISGVRRGQTAQRAQMQVLMTQPDGLLRLHPLLEWDQAQLDAYVERHRLPRHPLAEQGLTSIGCEPCTAMPTTAADARSGRWSGLEKTECGIHIF